MTKDLSDIACAIAGSVTQRTLENLRRNLEDLWVKSTAQGATAEEQAAFTPELIHQAHEAAMRDNAKVIVSWASAIVSELKYAEIKTKRTVQLAGWIATEKEKLAFFESDPATPSKVIQGTKEGILVLESRLRSLQEPAQTVPGRPSPPWTREVSSGDGDMAGGVSPLP